MKKKVLDTIRKHQMLEKDMHIVIGLSGGPDSLCMFDVFCRMAEEWQLKLHPVHVNHRFRPGAAEEDQAFAEQYCAEKGWPCRTFVRDCNAIAEAEGLTSEEAGRKVRYEAFGQVAADIAAELAAEGIPEPESRIVIAVGQNADDQAETVLFRLLRGTGVDGLSGIAYKRWESERFAVIRPLLDCSRSEIEEYCAEANLTPRRDHTNEEPVYMRNRIRLQLLPLLREQYNSNISAGLNRLAAAASMDSDYLWKEAEKAYEQAVVTETGVLVEFSLHILAGLHPSIRIRLYNKALEQIGLKENISAAHLDGVEAVLHSERPSAGWNLPESYMAEKRYDRLCFFKLSNSAETGQLRVTLDSPPMNDMAKSAVMVQLDAQALMDVYGADAAEKIILRTRQTGDYMTIFTGGGLHRKKLQDILVDMKVPKSLRGQVKLAAIGSEILWILPVDTGTSENSCAGRLGKNGRVTSAYKSGQKPNQNRIILEYLFQI